MRRQLEVDSITTDCSAHYLNLLSKDVEIPGVKEHIIQIVKYFRNTHWKNAPIRHSPLHIT